MEPKVSVVVPIYNAERYLNRCLESIVNQTYQNLEIILVDDGSPDNCPAMCDEWAKKDSRIQVIHKENEGPGMARNIGMDLATGEYIFFIDSDDYIDKELMEKCVLNAETNNSDAVLYGRIDAFEDGEFCKHTVSQEQLVFQGEEILNILLPSMFTYELGFGVSLWSKMFRLKTLKNSKVRLKSGKEIVSEDSYFTLEFFSHCTKATVIPECLYYYYQSNTSYSRALKKERQNENDSFLKQCVEYVEKENLPSQISNHIRSRYHGMTLGNLAQIMRSDLLKKEKKMALKTVYRNRALKETLTIDVIRLDAFLPRVFWVSLKLKLYGLCTMLLRWNNR